MIKRQTVCIASYKISYNFKGNKWFENFFVFVSITQSFFRFKLRHVKSICLQYHCQEHDKPMEQKFHFS
jgi:hypothetical protein